MIPYGARKLRLSRILMDTSKYKALYLQETYEHLSGIEKGLLKLEKEPAEPSTLDNLFRHYHSIKGMSASMGYEPIQKFAHAQEDLLDRLRQKKLSYNPEITTVLLGCLDALKNLVMRVEEDIPLDVNLEPFIAKLKAVIEGVPAVAAAPSTPAPEAPAEAEAAPELKLSHVMKVEGKVFDDLLTTVGDLFMVLSSFKSLSHETRSVAFKDGIYLLGKSINALHGNILSARMLPIQDLIESLPRLIRDMAGKSGKSVELKVSGADLSLDRAILEGLGAPMVHIIRNAVDHGIETVAERQASGKPPSGTIMINAASRKDRVIIEVSDDGKGIDVNKIKKKAVEKGLSPERVARMDDKEAMMLVCLPGLSGADTVTDTSGRGVGMDVVKAAIEILGGMLEIDSAPGKGTKITMELPRTTSIIKALTVHVRDEMFLLPISKIERVIEIGKEEAAGGVIEADCGEVSVFSLAKVFGIDEPDTGRETSTIIIVEDRKRMDPALGKCFIGLKVDDFGEEIDAYIKPLLPPISKLWGVSGITIMGDGRPVFLLDLPQIISKIDLQGT